MSDTEHGAATSVDRLRRATRVLITGHRRPDGDSLGSELALAELAARLGVDAVVINRDPAPPSLGELTGIEDVIVSDTLPTDFPDAYDLVVNGIEIGGGSIRIKDKDTQERIFRVLGLDKKEQERKFGFFLKALTYGAPPHGGIAMGFDRIVMMLAGEKSIRDVIPFPKTTSSLCLMTDSPSEIDEIRLRELGIRIIDKGGTKNEKE